ncbi:MAG: cbb3-type cytochrome c oxidase subunit II, partial [Thiohalorhabdaceae bacterium]
PHLLENELETDQLKTRLRTLKTVGVPYTEEKGERYQKNVERWGKEMAEKLHIPNAQETLRAEAEAGNYDLQPDRLTQMDAIVAYIQSLGTMVDFSEYSEPKQGRARGYGES